MSDTTATTRLEAVNHMLSTIGEAPVNTLIGDVNADVAIALDILSQTTKDVLATGWHFNTEHDYPLSRNGDNEIVLPAGIIKVDMSPTASNALNLVVRGTRLYNLDDHTYKFTDDIRATVVLLMDFESIPQLARSYILLRAARVFQGKMMASTELAREATTSEIMALADLKRWDDEQSDRTIFDNYGAARVLWR